VHVYMKVFVVCDLFEERKLPIFLETYYVYYVDNEQMMRVIGPVALII